DKALEQADIRITSDGLKSGPRLTVSAKRDGDKVTFLPAANYSAWISRAEILVFSQTDDFGTGVFTGPKKRKIVAALPVSVNANALWQMPNAETGSTDKTEIFYALRVYDDKGRFDETALFPLSKSQQDTDVSVEPGADVEVADSTLLRNIPVEGGAITIHGRNIPAGHHVVAMGKEIPVDGSGSFVSEQILPFGDHVVDVAVSNGQSDGITFARDVNIPAVDWFAVALADLTIGKRFASDAIEAADPARYGKVYSKGRLAFYLKGRIKGSVLLTAAADTGEGDLSSLFKGLDDKDPRQLLRRIDPDDYYPVYGDDSKLVEDAPTSGKFYVRLEDKNSSVMWGNFKSRVEGNGLLRSERALYGAQAVYKSENVTGFGANRYEASGFAAQPGTLPQRDVFRGTGGSVYFLKRQDITLGSETVSVVTTDPSTQRILSRKTLVAGKDYTIDYTQGVVLLSAPLSSVAGTTDGAVREGAFGTANASLAVSYEYTPGASEVEGYSYGGRIQAWLNDSVRIGATGLNEKTGGADHRMMGVDLRLRKTESTYLEVAYAQSKGPGFGRSISTDGGLT
ncbi:MAG: TonB-dependent receptor, partial [Notoacmeibacter sp.]